MFQLNEHYVNTVQLTESFQNSHSVSFPRSRMLLLFLHHSYQLCCANFRWRPVAHALVIAVLINTGIRTKSQISTER